MEEIAQHQGADRRCTIISLSLFSIPCMLIHELKRETPTALSGCLAGGNVTSLLRCHSQSPSHHMDHHMRQLARPGFSHSERSPVGWHYPRWTPTPLRFSELGLSLAATQSPSKFFQKRHLPTRPPQRSQSSTRRRWPSDAVVVLPVPTS